MPTHQSRIARAMRAAACAAGACAASIALADGTLIGRAVLPAATFADGPTSGTLIGAGPINGIEVPFVNKQPVQGFSAIHDNGDGTFLAMSDNGFGGIENSADFNLRVYTIRPNFEVAFGGSGAIDVLAWIELHDPDHHVPFAIANHFSLERVLTGADFDLESMQRAQDGTLWFGDEFGPFLIHTTASGRVIEPPIALPNFVTTAPAEIRSPQSPFNEERAAIRIMNAMRNHARLHGNDRTPVFSPWHVMFDDSNPATFVGNRAAPPAGSGLVPASSEIFNVASMQNAGYPVVCWTVNDIPRMNELMTLKVNGIISDRPDLLLQAVVAFDANGDGMPGDWLLKDGTIDGSKFDAQGHRGARGLRPENTLPALEAGLDNLMPTLELDCGVTLDGVPILDHDPLIQSTKAHLASGKPYTEADEVLVKDLTAAEIQTLFIADLLQPAFPVQDNDPALSPVAADFAREQGFIDPYIMPTLSDVFEFVQYYIDFYKSGAGKDHLDAAKRWANAERVRYNIETKRNPRREFVDRTVGSAQFADAVAGVIEAYKLEQRADIQSFDFSTLIVVHEKHSAIRTVCLFGDFPIYDDPSVAGSDDGTNLQDEYGENTPWLAGLYWPYRVTKLDFPPLSAQSGGYEGMAISTDNTTLLPLLERPVVGDVANTLRIFEFDLARGQYTGVSWKYTLQPQGTNIGDFIMFNPSRGLIIERDGSQGVLTGFKAIYEIRLSAPGANVQKGLVANLMDIADPDLISLPGLPGDVGLGDPFAFPFTTIEDVVVFDETTIGVLNDNNFPFSVGRHVGSGAPDDEEFIVLELDQPLGSFTAQPGDLNGDGIVDGVDLALLLGQWGACTNDPCEADLNGDDIVNGLDLAILLASWG